MACWAFWCGAYYFNVQEAVLSSIAAVVFSGLVANTVVVQAVQAGPAWVAALLQVGR